MRVYQTKSIQKPSLKNGIGRNGRRRSQMMMIHIQTSKIVIVITSKVSSFIFNIE